MSRALPDEARAADAELRAMQRGDRTPYDAPRTRSDGPRSDVSPEKAHRLTISLPLPARDLSPNARGVPWQRRAELVRAARTEASWVAGAAVATAGHVRPFRACAATVQITYRDRRRHDLDNTFASLKSAFDGFTDAGVWVDDSMVTWVIPPSRVDKQGAGVQITIEPKGE